MEPGRKLYLAFAIQGAVRARYRAEFRNIPELVRRRVALPCIKIAVNSKHMRPVENVEPFSDELESHRLAEPKALRQPNV